MTREQIQSHILHEQRRLQDVRFGRDGLPGTRDLSLERLIRERLAGLEALLHGETA